MKEGLYAFIEIYNFNINIIKYCLYWIYLINL